MVLNAKYHEREAEIVAQAGRFGAVTIATNMAGRGTDIILGGVPDHRVKAVLAGKELDPEPAPPEEWDAAARAGRSRDGRASSSASCSTGSSSPEERRDAGQALPRA